MLQNRAEYNTGLILNWMEVLNKDNENTKSMMGIAMDWIMWPLKFARWSSNPQCFDV